MKVVTLMVNVCSDSDTVVDHAADVNVFACFNTGNLFCGKDCIDHFLSFFKCRALVKDMECTVSSYCKVSALSDMYIGTVMFDSIIHQFFKCHKVTSAKK